MAVNSVTNLRSARGRTSKSIQSRIAELERERDAAVERARNAEEGLESINIDLGDMANYDWYSYLWGTLNSKYVGGFGHMIGQLQNGISGAIGIHRLMVSDRCCRDDEGYIRMNANLHGHLECGLTFILNQMNEVLEWMENSCRKKQEAEVNSEANGH